jgi:hypothetical protein
MSQRAKEASYARDWYRRALHGSGRAPGYGPPSTKRVARAIGTSDQWVRKMLGGSGPLATTMEYLVSLVGSDTSPMTLISAAYARVLSRAAETLDRADLTRRLDAATKEATVQGAHLAVAQHHWMSSDRSLADLREYIAAVLPAAEAQMELLFTAQALERKGAA